LVPLARKEWIDYVSDLDWTYLIDGQAKSLHLKISQDIQAALRTEFQNLSTFQTGKRKQSIALPNPVPQAVSAT
jgi:hypothetical protein